jgi:hypothetical protein
LLRLGLGAGQDGWRKHGRNRLYDLQEDPGELHNLYGETSYATLTRDLRQRIRELRKETGDHDTGSKL